MTRTFQLISLSFACIVAIVLPGIVSAQTTSTTVSVARGIALTQEISTGSDPLIINVLKVDLRAPGVRVQCGQAFDAITMNGPTKGRETVHSLAERHGAIAAINADFFPYTGDPLGLAIRDGELLSEPMDYRACIGIGKKGVVMDVVATIGAWRGYPGSKYFIDGINRVPGAGETVVLTPSFQATPTLKFPAQVLVLRNVNLPLKVSKRMRGNLDKITELPAGRSLPVCPVGGALIVIVPHEGENPDYKQPDIGSIEFQIDLVSNSPPPAHGRYPSLSPEQRRGSLTNVWKDVEQAVGGGPWLVREGMLDVDGEAEGMSKKDFIDMRHPRTAAGVTKDGKLLLVTVDGRVSWSRGASLAEMAKIMLRFGAYNAINLDGGGSTTMVVDGGVVNAPSDGRERPVADGLLVYSNQPPRLAKERYHFDAQFVNGLTLHVGESAALHILDSHDKPVDARQQIIWGTADGLGFLSQSGIYTSYRAGDVLIYAQVGAKKISMPVHVLPNTTTNKEIK